MKTEGNQIEQNDIDIVDESPEILSRNRLMWRKFKKNKLGIAGGIVVLLFYLMVLFGGFLSPYTLDHKDYSHITAPPRRIRIIDEEGLSAPFVYGYEASMDPETLQRNYALDKESKYYIDFLYRGDNYEFLGLFNTDLHLFGVNEGQMYLLGTDETGGDLLTKIILGGRISLSISLLGPLISLIIGAILGTVSGYVGGIVDGVIQRVIEFFKSFPRIPLWLTLAAALPANWSSLRVYIGIVVILAFLGWTGLARMVRGKIMSLREEDFVSAAVASGSTGWWIVRKHLIPNAMSQLIVSATLSIPSMILAEASLSFLGLGIRAPMTSWGVLLQEAQNVRTIALHPWLFTPALFIIVAILGFNFLGDGLRDAADPFSN
ncbi:peptide/nickel transport system permease protein [Halanaerobium saccharolyticum]|uniref:Peptide/nickel transport system permease protein n=1 Tax=Halanaerobium saccharolyticum TaxID=43595 RepID=A0A4R7YZ62_9FIRM|nr:ABC transporter permease [Halanaerobium saccharolyticum]RAK06886.1 peptide/nickel transport system permease protein [Halanaerobium saccharolyticum]TDW01496.1 peptide/nickel transport system permease protein [Halanaerobium saccharolyticum]TDX52857.1 peptide/nickel transport system permease protein [Halanaerobium saccharolyticum]